MTDSNLSSPPLARRAACRCRSHAILIRICRTCTGKNAPYSYEVSSLALDDYATSRGLFPTHLKIDVDGAEFSVLKGAEKILGNETLTDIFIEIDHENDGIFGFLEARGFSVSWRHDKPQNADVLFTR